MLDIRKGFPGFIVPYLLIALFFTPAIGLAATKSNQKLVGQSKAKVSSSATKKKTSTTVVKAKKTNKKAASKKSVASYSAKKSKSQVASRKRRVKASPKHAQSVARTIPVAPVVAPADTRTEQLVSASDMAEIVEAVPAVPLPSDGYFDPVQAPGKLSSRSYIVLDADAGGSILAKYPDAPRQPASTIKILTGMIAIKSLRDDDTVSVSKKAASMPSSKVFLNPQKKYSATDLINSVLLASANDASVALAERIAGSESRFAKLMTYSAKKWGARDTICQTASGLTAEGQHTTARDLAHLFRVAMQDQEFAGRVGQREAETAFGKTLVNHNKALWRVDGAIGGKTGFTNAARQTYVGQFARNGHTIVVAIMGSETMWADLRQLVDYGFKRKNEEMARLRGKAAM